MDSTAGLSTSQNDAQDLTLLSASAISSRDGVLLQWHTGFELDNVGFNIYRLRDGERLQVNRSLVPGSVFVVGEGKPVPEGRSYKWFDSEGTTDSVYYIESEDLNGKHHAYQSLIEVTRAKRIADQQAVDALSGSLSGQSASLSQGLKEYPGEMSGSESVQAQPGSQWFVAGQSALKIRINHDGWYRVTQQQMSAAGFNPVVDVKNLSVFADGVEIAIKTSKVSGPLTTGDYFEFYGRGLDTPESDTRIYYLIAGTLPGKRSKADLQPDASVVSAAGQPSFVQGLEFSYAGRFAPLVVNLATGQSEPSPREQSSQSDGTSIESNRVRGSVTPPHANAISAYSTPVVSVRRPQPEGKAPAASEPVIPIVANPGRPAAMPAAGSKSRKKTTRLRRKSQRRRAKSAKTHFSHAPYETTATVLSYDYTVQLKERYAAPGFFPVFFTKAVNGEGENWFGRVISSAQVLETIPVHSVSPTPDGLARLEVALQGVLGTFPSHQVDVFVNNVSVGTMTFFGLDHPVKTFNVPASQLLEGNNTVKFVRVSSNDVSIVDYVTLTYPHTYEAFNNSLRFTARQAQTLQVTGFSTPNVQLIDISDPAAVKVTQPLAAPSGTGFAITVPPAPKSKVRKPRFGVPELEVPRTIYALPQGQFETPAGFALNQASSLNLPSAQNPANAADLLILSHKDFIPSLAPLVAKRQALPDLLTVKLVDIDDVYDEFSYGAHDHHAIKELLLRATAVWTKAPKFLLLVGDASYDPRNYQAFVSGSADFVPTNLIDTLFGEACSDDVMADFNGDGIAEIPVGRIPAASVAEANLMVGKIVGFVKTNVPQTALFVADNAAETNYYFNFDTASDALVALLPSSLTPQKVYRSTQPTCTARTNVINAINTGVALVNYSGHGNANVWAGSCFDPNQRPFFGTADATGLNNQNRLPLVLVANCLNGYFNGPNLESLGESFIKASNGGAVAVYASSGETIPDGQQQMNIKLYQTLFGTQSMALGDVTKLAKTATTDMDVRRTWILLGDPSMKIW